MADAWPGANGDVASWDVADFPGKALPWQAVRADAIPSVKEPMFQSMYWNIFLDSTVIQMMMRLLKRE